MRSTFLHIFSSLMLASFFSPVTTANADPIHIVALGDSNTAGLFAGRRNAFPAVLEGSLRAQGYDVRVSNRGISGDTTVGMLARLDSAVPRNASIVILQGGYNDRRRGVSEARTAANVDRILATLTARRIKVVLCGLDGAEWSSIARRHRAKLVPSSDCYDAANRGFDRLHMNRAGHRVVAARLEPTLRQMIGAR